MSSSEITINGKKIWLTFEPIRIYNAEGSIQVTDYIICYFSLEKPMLMNGELLRDAIGHVEVFKSEKDAVAKASEVISQRLK